MRTIRDADLRGKRVLVRVDFNVPLRDGKVEDDTRIRAALPTIRAIREKGAKAIALSSHLGRPKGPDPKLSLAPVAARLAELLGEAVRFVPESVPAEVPDGISLLENSRFHPEEEKNDPAFAKRLAAPFDVYVNDAFGAAHRAHASTEGVARVLPAYSGFLLEKEVATLRRLLESPERPFLAIVGGAKVSSKIDVLRALIAKADTVAIGGGMANTFLAAQGQDVKASLSEPDKEDDAREILAAAKARGVEVLLPDDVRWKDDRILDIGPGTAARYTAAIAKARTIFWNGPMGMFEDREFAAGTEAVAKAMATAKATTVVGGGESVQAVERLGLADRMTHVSTGGGASLELIEGKTLPGVAAIPA